MLLISYVRRLSDSWKAHFEIPPAKMQTNSHICWTSLEKIVVGLDIRVQQCFMVYSAFLHAFNHGFCTEVGQQGIVKLYVAYAYFVWSITGHLVSGPGSRLLTAASGIERLDFFLVGDCDISKVFRYIPDRIRSKL
jgi:hypothetical protein